MKNILIMSTVITLGLSPAFPADAQNYVVNGHAASKAEAQLLTSYKAQPGHWSVDGFGIAKVSDEHPVATEPSRSKCYYVLDVLLCD
jgi:hypothetical protein